MSSFITHKRMVEDPNLPLTHRFSHARSCLNMVAEHGKLSRAQLIVQIELKCGVNMLSATSEKELQKGFNCLLKMREAQA